MLTQTVTITQNSNPNIIIGRRSTYETQQVIFDVSWLIQTYGEGTAELLIKRPKDASAYPVVATLDGNTLTWTVSETDTQDKGHGECEIYWYVNGGLAKSCICGITILRDIGETTETAPDPYETWVDELARLGSETLANAQAAEQSANNAAQSATEAAQSASAAESSAANAQESADNSSASADRAEQAAASIEGDTERAEAAARTAQGAASDASGFAGTASTKATEAAGSAATAEQAASTATQKAADASASATAAAGSASSASASATAAGNAQTAAETAQGKAEDAQEAAETAAQSIEDSAAQIDQNAEDILDLKSALDTKAGILRDTVSGSVASFVPDSTVPDLLGLSVALEPIQDLHGYDSPWPAGGGKNLIDPAAVTPGKRLDNVGGEVTASAWAISDWIPCSPNTDYRVRGSISSANGYAFCFYDANKEFLRYQVIVGTNPVGGVRNSGADAAFVRVTITNTNTASVAYLAPSSADNSFSPYSNLCPISGRESVAVNANGTTYTIQLGNTVYGGTLDVTAGTLTVDRAKTTVGALSWSLYNTAFYASIQMGTSERPISPQYKSEPSASSIGDASGWADYSIRAHTSGIYIYIKDTRYSTAPDFKTAEADTEIVYELATPIVIDLDPVQIATIANQTNNVWADAGDVTVEFAADLKTYIDSKIAAAVAAMS